MFEAEEDLAEKEGECREELRGNREPPSEAPLPINATAALRVGDDDSTKREVQVAAEEVLLDEKVERS